MEQISVNTHGCDTSCPFCPRREFVGRKALEEHWRNSKSHGWCQGCEELFSSRFSYAQHMSNEHNCPLSTCEAHPCSASSTSRSLHDEHTLPHARRRPPPNATPLREPQHAVVCFGCDRLFQTYCSMMLHLEEGACHITTHELGSVATSAVDSDLYVLPQWREYLHNHYGYERVGFDTDTENENRYECTECRVIFFSIKQANQHAKSPVHKPLVFKCPGCAKQYSALSGILQHVEHSTACKEGVYGGTGAMGRLLQLLEERVRGRRAEDAREEEDFP